MGGKCSENKINSKWGIMQKVRGICTWGILDFRMGDFECSPKQNGDRNPPQSPSDISDENPPTDIFPNRLFVDENVPCRCLLGSN